jgi:hypothetical protein
MTGKFVKAPVNIFDHTIGPWLSRIGRTYNMLATPCSTTPEVWVEAAWVNLPHLLFGFIKPFKLAMAYDIHSGRGKRFGIGHRAGLKGKKGKAPYGAILEGLLEDAGGMGGAAGRWAVFELGDLALKIDWYFFLADITTDFLVNWVSTAYQWSGCEDPGRPYAHAHALEGFFYLPIFPGAIYDGWAWDESRGIATGVNGCVVDSGVSASVGYSLTTGPWPADPTFPQATWSSQLMRNRHKVGDAIPAAPSRNGGLGVTHMIPGYAGDDSGGIYEVFLDINTDGVWYCTGGRMTASTQQGGLHPDP